MFMNGTIILVLACAASVVLASIVTADEASGADFKHGWGPEKSKQISGYLHVNKNTAHIFFWMFESRHDPKNAPLVLWMVRMGILKRTFICQSFTECLIDLLAIPT